MEIPSKQEQKINYKEKNYEYLEKIKEKKQRSAEQKAILQKKQQIRKQRLKRKILQEARINRRTRETLIKRAKRHRVMIHKLLQERGIRSVSMHMDSRYQKYHHHRLQAHPRLQTQMMKIKRLTKNDIQPFFKTQHKITNQKNRYRNKKKRKGSNNMLESRNSWESTKCKVKLELFSKRKTRISKISLLEAILHRNLKIFARIVTINQHLEINGQQTKTNQRFKKKNDQYIQKIKKRRADQEKVKQEQHLKKQKLKQKLKDFVMNTVKKNVLDGVYDDQIIDKHQKKKKKVASQKDIAQSKQKDQDSQKSQQSSQEQQETQNVKTRKRKMRSFPHVSDLSEWKKKNRLQADEKVFIVTGGYPQLKKALRERGWVQNPDCNSPCFNMKYTLQGRQIDYDNLKDFQLVNHFSKNGCITTKIGLTKSLRNLIWVNDTSQDNFYPKCFDLNDQDDYVGFQMHFKLCKALSILKIYSDFVLNKKYSKNQSQNPKDQKSIVEDLKLRTEIAVSVCRKNIQDINEIIDKKKNPQIITDKQWQILAQDQLNQEGLAKKKHEQWLKTIDVKYNSIGARSIKKQQKVQKPKKKKTKKKQQKAEQANEKADEQDQNEQQANDPLFDEVSQILQVYEAKYPQYHLTGHNNIWILKPAGLSRGRGITCYNNLVQIQDHVKCKESQWIAQKYIENPVVILRRKFDIRQWVLVTDFNPLVIWNYDQSYVRFSAVDYDPKQVSNKFIHLTNNAIGSTNKEFKNSHIKGNMFFKDQLSEYLKQLEGYDVYQQKIKPQIKQIVKLSMMCAVENIENRKGTHQLFGYDFMIDTNYKVWLIQINSSPSMDYSTHVTSKLVKECLTDIIKVVVDYQSASKKDRKNIDTGNFKKIYKGTQIPEKPISTGLNLCLEGTAVKKPKKNFVKVQNYSLENKKDKVK